MTTVATKNIFCLGEVLWDQLPSGPQPGGAPLNVSIHLQRQGQNPVLVSRVGNDEPGTKLLSYLKQAGICTQLVLKDESLPTSEVVVHLDADKNATYEICEPVAWDHIVWTSAIEAAAMSADLIMFGSLASRHKTTRETLLGLVERSSAPSLLDVNLRAPYDQPEVLEQLMHAANFLKLNDDELRLIAGWHGQTGTEAELVSWMASFYNCTSICLTRGAHGALLWMEGAVYEHAGFVVAAVDTVGAGDSFLASLVAQLMNGSSPQDALAMACATGAFVASKAGAVPVYSNSDIEQIMQLDAPSL